MAEVFVAMNHSEQFYWLSSLGIGRVRKVRHKFTSSEYACKEIVPDSTTTFDHHCIDAVARSNHPHIVQVHDRWLEQFPTQKVFVQTELLDGDLNQYIEYHRSSGTQISYLDVWNITLDMVDALTYAHELGWSHRNLKPTNVLAKKIGVSLGRPQFNWKICDWGLAPALLPAPTVDDPQTHIPTSDDVYRAPEHRHSPSAAVDIWSIGCILFELATNGVLAFPVNPDDPTYVVENGKSPAKMATVKTPQVLMDPDGHINRALSWCLNPTPALRPTARQLGIYIRGIIDDLDRCRT